MRWTLGESEIERLLAGGELQRVPGTGSLAPAMLDAARAHVASARDIGATDPDGAYALLYDAARKACAALLQAQGLRATSKGGHIAIRDAVRAQFGHPPRGQVLRRLDQMRRRRNELEYPIEAGAAVDIVEIDEVIAWAADIVSYCEVLLPQLDRQF